MLSEIAAATSALSGIKTVIEGFVVERDALKLQQTRAELFKLVADGWQAVFSLQEQLALKSDEIATLKEKVRDLEARLIQREEAASQFSEYELGQVAPGVFVFTPKPDTQGVRRQPYLCPTCKGEGKHSVLSFQRALNSLIPNRLVCGVNAQHTLPLPRGYKSDSLGRPEYLDAQ